jgi:hypothetical protein
VGTTRQSHGDTGGGGTFFTHRQHFNAAVLCGFVNNFFYQLF